MKVILLVITFFALLLPEASATPEGAEEPLSPVIEEHFDTLHDWEPLTFPKIPRHSNYSIVELDGKNVLKAHSNNSASALVHKERFNVFENPVLRFRWRVENVFVKGDARKRSGDDYPARVYVLFEYDSSDVGLGTRLQYSAARLLYGEYPPHSTINYIWESRETDDSILTSAYTSRARLFILRSGNELTGYWLNEERNILEDYRKAFGEDPPKIATLAIMSDADNTEEEAISYFDFITVSSE